MVMLGGEWKVEDIIKCLSITILNLICTLLCTYKKGEG